MTSTITRTTPFDNPTGSMVTVFKRRMKIFRGAVDTAST
jgi:hypothetical protein